LIARYLRNHPRIETFRTDFELYGKFHVRWIGGHTKGSSAVFFRHAGEAFVLTGDEVFFRENVAASRLSGEIVDRRRNRSFLRELNRIPALRILTFHDPGIVPAEQEWIRIT
jgi:glyoxylase-like metal-dependent hydrolase (beta-lactamase superfamily II)